MIEISNVEVTGWESAIRGMRNPLNSWDNSDSYFGHYEPSFNYDDPPEFIHVSYEANVGEADLDLMRRLASAGSDHAKYRRMINVTCDIVAPLYWWKEYDTYKVGTVANSCSTMHKIQAKEFTLEDFSHEHLLAVHNLSTLGIIISDLNDFRRRYLKTKDKAYWWQLIQLLPSSYNQRRTVQFNYEVLANMYRSRKNHKLDEWRNFCTFIEQLPHSELITGGK